MKATRASKTGILGPALCLVAAAAAFAPRPAAAAASQIRALYVGASVVAGEFASSSEATFPARLDGLLGGTGIGVSATKVAVAGASTAQAAAWTLGSGYQLVVVDLGNNDYRTDVPLATYRTVYGRLLGRIRAASPAAVLVCLGSWSGLGFTNRIGLTGRQYDRATASECSAAGGLFVAIGDLYWAPHTRGPAARPTPWGASDTFHPNDRGHLLIASRIFWSLRYFGLRWLEAHGGWGRPPAWVVRLSAALLPRPPAPKPPAPKPTRRIADPPRVRQVAMVREPGLAAAPAAPAAVIAPLPAQLPEAPLALLAFALAAFAAGGGAVAAGIRSRRRR